MKRSITTLIIALDIVVGFYLLFGLYLPSKLKKEEPSLKNAHTNYSSLSQIVNPKEYYVKNHKTSSLPRAIDIKSMAGPVIVIETEREEQITQQEIEEAPYQEIESIEYPPPSLSDYKPLRKGFHAGKYLFNVPAGLENEVEFWKNTYGQYDEFHSVLHDGKYLNIVYGIVDFTPLYKDPSMDLATIYKKRSKIIEREKKKIEAVLLKLHSNPPATELNDMEWNIKRIFRDVPDEDKFLQASKDKRIREQTGLQNKFLEGLIVSGEYLGKIEEIFVNLGMPRELTRLIFVESMFNIRARSKVGASGVWQFMPDTAKRYIIVNDIIDERNDPIKATLAAAKLLKHNYDELKTWPLAINAYNSGAGRMKKAVKQLGTRSIEKIIHNFEDKSGYGFASRNFYPSFLAALEVAENNRYYFGEIELESPQRYDQIITTHPTSITELAKLCNISIETLKHLNTALNEKLFEPLTYLPKGYELRVPNDKGNHALIIMRMMAEKEGGVKWHTASKNEGVSNLAKKYNVPAWKIRKDNNLWGTKLAQGQVVKISK